MSLFGLPKGELELLVDGVWTSVMFTDRLTREELKGAVKLWSERHEVTSARYNGKEIEI